MQVLRPAQLDQAARATVLETILPIHRTLFSGIDRAALARYAFEPGTPHRWVGVVRDGDAIVGYCAVHITDLCVQGRAIRVLRGAGGLLPGYRRRGRLLFARFVVARASWALLTGRGRSLWFSGAIMNPAAYRMLTDVLDVVHPSVHAPLEPQTQQFLHGVADALNMPLGVAGDPGVRQVGWTVAFSPEEQAHIEASADPVDRYFCAHNPRYAEGEGLVFLAQLTPATVAQGLVRAARVRKRPHRPYPTEERPCVPIN